ncbi:class II glutamine amidotransferase [Kitasatospora acidiphila]|uniref:Class II glutamine amidotransferase n=1 Tax=Kitasatospora acidiphila TaxID=2567942 RepID=A0A540W9E4_9ACTN|nr:class II glutamine amidotransferase [Kitasatospora acidiphila]TQF05636.1 class II glutamine amidotransferase [Kitasatospora acidiphila]
MCRWLAYSGTPILLDELIYKPEHSLIDQSRHSRLGAETTNGDGFGVGWYTDPAVGPLDPDETPAVFHGVGPAWSNRNLHDLASHVRSHLFFAHIRAATGTGTATQESNCHPFRYKQWLWMHNGLINRFHEIRRELMLAVDPSLFPSIEGTTDSETMFYLALTLGMENDVPGAVERMIGLVEATAARHGIPNAINMTVAVSDGDRLWAFRYSTERATRSLFYSTDVDSLRALHPEVGTLRLVSDETRIVVSEPLGALSGAWNPVPECSYGCIRDGQDEMHELVPQAA